MVSLDSTFLIDLLRGDEHALRRVEQMVRNDERLCITPPAAAEVMAGGHRMGGKCLERTRKLLESLHWLPFDEEAADVTGELASNLMSRGRSIGEGDLFIAGISLRHGEKLLTRDKRFADVPSLEVEFY